MDATSAQVLINSGMAWMLEGSVGRECMRMIESGNCMLGIERRRDYWGNMVPARRDVQAGTKGSREFVVEHSGEDHAQMLELAPTELLPELNIF